MYTLAYAIRHVTDKGFLAPPGSPNRAVIGQTVSSVKFGRTKRRANGKHVSMAG
jgi:hypothetical protein